MSIIVFGSINLDLVARTAHIPAPGETIVGQHFATLPGGKGANQAVAAARLGLPTELVGRVGSDQFGELLLQSLSLSGVGCAGVTVDSTTHSGVALIAVDDASENSIIVVPGANGQVGASDLQRLYSLLPQAKVLLLQLELPLSVGIAAAKAAKQIGVTVIFDPAPARPDLPSELYPLIDIITPNQIEAGQLAGFEVNSLATAQQAAAVLHRQGVGTVIIKLGQQGAVCLNQGESFEIPAFPVKAVDTVAAGDCFNGGLAAGLAAGMNLRAAMRQAAAAAALSVTRAGAQPSLPTRAELDRFLASFDL